MEVLRPERGSPKGGGTPPPLGPPRDPGAKAQSGIHSPAKMKELRYKASWRLRGGNGPVSISAEISQAGI